ncbi:MAG: response regulator [Chloroflexaceae bacterium]|nr:response regulator [Chloroflexaceae bacterium]
MATILVIDDDLTLLARLGTILEQEGYDVLKNSAVEPAQAVFDERPPDLVVLEVRTSRDGGWSLLKHFSPHVPVIVLSTQAREEDVVRGLEAGAVDYISKPYRTAELLTRIRMRLNGVLQAHPARPVRSPPPPLPAPLPQASESPTEPAPDGTQNGGMTDHRPPPQLEPARAYASRSHSCAGSGTSSDEPVFMPEKEEIALLRSSTEMVGAAPDESTLPEDTSLKRQMYLARRRKQITLVQAENELSIGMAYLQAMEDEKYSLLPQGPLATHMLRSYAAYLGLDVSSVLQEYEKSHTVRFIEPSFGRRHPLAWLRAVQPPRWVVWVAAVLLALIVSGAGIFFLDPHGVEALGSKLYHLVDRSEAVASPSPTATVTAITSPTVEPSPTATATPSPVPTRSPTPRPSPTLNPSPDAGTTPAPEEPALPGTEAPPPGAESPGGTAEPPAGDEPLPSGAPPEAPTGTVALPDGTPPTETPPAE